jgi:hypothetical protein
MENNQLNSPDFLHKGQGKGNDKARFYKHLLDNPCTCTQAALALQVPQKSCTRYKRQLEELGILAVIKLVRCPITGFNHVQLLTTDKALFPEQPKQLDLWN